MHNLMQDFELRSNTILDHAAKYHKNRKIITRSIEGPIHETTYSETHLRARKVAQALERLGLNPHETVGVMAWNTYRHLEVWYGIPGMGGVIHTLNPRLFADQLVYIVNHAEDKALVIDFDLLPIIEAVWDKLETVEHVILMTDRAHMPTSDVIPNLLCYEDLLAAEDGDYVWFAGDERDACGICYTSGTTGNPKGVVYTHRSNILHALAVGQPDGLGLTSCDTFMPVVPLFHANGWSTAYTGPMTGVTMVMPGRDMSPAGIYEMLEMGVTSTAAVPTIWLGLLQYLEAEKKSFSTLAKVVIGGSSCPRAVIEAFQQKYGVRVFHAWGMTEMSPLGTVGSFKPEIACLSDEEKLDTQETTGHPPYTVDLKITDDEGNELPWDGESQGMLWARGPGVIRTYLKHDGDAVDADGWFDTGDVATITQHGYMSITDRSKDVIKSGGEWISSIELENAAIAHPDVAEAAAIGMPHPKWDERPVLVIVKKPNAAPDPADIIATVAKGFAKWQVPDDVVFMDEIPHTATGKISKLNLRKQLKELDYQLPDQRG